MCLVDFAHMINLVEESSTAPKIDDMKHTDIGADQRKICISLNYNALGYEMVVRALIRYTRDTLFIHHGLPIPDGVRIESTDAIGIYRWTSAS